LAIVGDEIFYYLVCEAIGIAATPGLLCQPRVIVKMIVEKQMECRLAGETEVLGENLPQVTRLGLNQFTSLLFVLRAMLLLCFCFYLPNFVWRA
jgi:hypothetical protein